MAKKITLARAVAGDQAMNKIGTYKESTGGGTPLKKGEKLRDHPEAHRVSQPRDEEGKFTYNAANAKPLAYGPSRGVTIPPFLKGVKLTYAIKKDTVINYNGLTHLAGIDMTASQFIDSFKEYKLDKGFGKVSQEIIARKRGRKSNLEKDVIANNDDGIIAKDGNQREEIKTVGYRGDKERFISQFKNYKNKQKPKGKNKFANKKDKINVSLAKTNPAKFIAKNKVSLEMIVKKMQDKGYKNFNKKAFVNEIAKGKYKNWQQIYSEIDKIPPKK